MSFLKNLREVNKTRSAAWSKGTAFPLSFHATELAGETGEVCNDIKKLYRLQHGLEGGVDTMPNLREELADVIICADLLAMKLDINLEEEITKKFNKVSEKYGFKERLGEKTPVSEMTIPPVPQIKEEKTLIINGKPVVTKATFLTYTEIVYLTNPSWVGTNPSVMFHSKGKVCHECGRKDQIDGMMHTGTTVHISDGMIFSVVHTNNA